jgi:hypothetical protein
MQKYEVRRKDGVFEMIDEARHPSHPSTPALLGAWLWAEEIRLRRSNLDPSWPLSGNSWASPTSRNFGTLLKEPCRGAAIGDSLAFPDSTAPTNRNGAAESYCVAESLSRSLGSVRISPLRLPDPWPVGCHGAPSRHRNFSGTFYRDPACPMHNLEGGDASRHWAQHSRSMQCMAKQEERARRQEGLGNHVSGNQQRNAIVRLSDRISLYLYAQPDFNTQAGHASPRIRANNICLVA